MPTVEDTITEEDERFGLLLTLLDPDHGLFLPPGYAGKVFLDAAGSLAVGTIADDDGEVDQPPAWTLTLVRDDLLFETVAETDADAAYASTFLLLERGSSTAPLPESLAVTVGGTAANPADYEFNRDYRFTSVNRKSANLMRGARKITVKGDELDEGAETITFSVTIEGQTLTATLTIADDDGPRLAVADASVQEDAGAVLAFRVTLAPEAEGPVTVDWETVDGTATEGSDYTAGSGTLTFAAGDTEKTIEVAVLDDSIDEGSETMTLRLSNPSGAVLGDAEAVGTITNTDAMPRAWIARFGRTVADQVIDAVQARMETAPATGSEVRLGGHAMGGEVSPEAWEALDAACRDVWFDNRTGARDDWIAGGTGGSGTRCRYETHGMTGQELLTGSSFRFTDGSAESGFGTVWGRAAATGFDGRAGEVSLDGGS